jgi:hypothetical protein
LQNYKKFLLIEIRIIIHLFLHGRLGTVAGQQARFGQQRKHGNRGDEDDPDGFRGR